MPRKKIQDILKSQSSSASVGGGARAKASDADAGSEATKDLRSIGFHHQPEAAHEASVIVLHGLDDSGHYWELLYNLLRGLGVSLAGVRWIAPTAPKRNMLGDVMNGWFTYLTDMSGKEEEDEFVVDELLQTRKTLHDLIAEEASALKDKGGYQRVLLGGTSQGGCMALDVALTAPLPVAGVMMLRGLPLTASMKAAQERKEEERDSWSSSPLPALLISGEQDEVYPASFVSKQVKLLEQTKVLRVAHHIVAGLDHDTDHDPKELTMAGEFVRSTLRLPAEGPIQEERVKEWLDSAGTMPVHQKSWAQLTEEEQRHAKRLGITTEKSWDEGTAPVWSKAWNSLPYIQKVAAKSLGFTPKLWDDRSSEQHLLGKDKSWAKLTDEERGAAQRLGVKGQNAWDNATAPVWSKTWQKLTPPQQKAAKELGFDQESWDAEDDDE